MPKWYQSSHYPQPIECTQILAMRAVPALSESEHRDRLKEASDTRHRKYCTNGSRRPSGAEGKFTVDYAWNPRFE